MGPFMKILWWIVRSEIWLEYSDAKEVSGFFPGHIYIVFGVNASSV